MSVKWIFCRDWLSCKTYYLEISTTHWIKSFLKILPEGVLGIEVTNITRRIFLYGTTFSYNNEFVSCKRLINKKNQSFKLKMDKMQTLKSLHVPIFWQNLSHPLCIECCQTSSQQKPPVFDLLPHQDTYNTNTYKYKWMACMLESWVQKYKQGRRR